jgi:hypothetical protein
MSNVLNRVKSKEKMMINFTTQREYQGSNVDALDGLGDEFCTFRQAVRYFNLSGKELKGAKSCARLMKIIEKDVIVKGKKEKKKVPTYFNVFEKGHLMQVIESNA